MVGMQLSEAALNLQATRYENLWGDPSVPRLELPTGTQDKIQDEGALFLLSVDSFSGYGNGGKYHSSFQVKATPTL